MHTESTENGIPSSERDRLVDNLHLLYQWQRLRRKDSQLPHRPFIIEFAGMPKSGKSITIEGIRHFFTYAYLEPRFQRNQPDDRKYRYSVDTPAEGVSLRTPAILKSKKLDFNSWAGAYAIQQLLQAYQDNHFNMVVLDRGPWDASCWLQYWIGKLDVDDVSTDIAQRLEDVFNQDYWTIKSDLHVVLFVDPKVAALREQSERIVQAGGVSSDLVLMTSMKSIYEERFQKLRRKKLERCPHVGEKATLDLDTTNRLPWQVIARVIDGVYEVLKLKLAYESSDFTFSRSAVKKSLSDWLSIVKTTERKQIVEYLSDFSSRANLLPKASRRTLWESLERSNERARKLEHAREADTSMIERLESMLQKAYKTSIS